MFAIVSKELCTQVMRFVEDEEVLEGEWSCTIQT